MQCLPYISPSTERAPWIEETSPNRWKVNLTTWQIGHRAAVNFNKIFHRKEDAEKFVHNKVWLYKQSTVQATRVPGRMDPLPAHRLDTAGGACRRGGGGAQLGRVRCRTPIDFGSAQAIRGGTVGLVHKAALPPIPNPMIKSPREARMVPNPFHRSILRPAPATAPPSGIRPSMSFLTPPLPPPRTAPMTV